jgi:hypothetical protein
VRPDTPRLTPSIRIARTDISLERIAIIYPGTKRYPLADDVEAVPLEALANGAAIFPDEDDSSPDSA